MVRVKGRRFFWESEEWKKKGEGVGTEEKG